jgi:cob(I)alamin adenosyltransferase
MKGAKAYAALRTARTDARLVGRRAKALKEKAESKPAAGAEE